MLVIEISSDVYCHINVCYLFFILGLGLTLALILHSWVLLSYKLFLYPIYHINLEYH